MAFSSSVGFTLRDGSVRSPDASWISDARRNELSPQEKEGFGRITPEFLIEVLSKSDSWQALEAKMDMWIANGARLAWMIDPYVATLSIYRAGRPVELRHRPDSLEAEEIVPGFRLTTGTLWAE